MKLHLPKQLFTALLSVMAACASLTCNAADIISINFTHGTTGELPGDTASITGELEGIGASGWQNINASNQTGTVIKNQANTDVGTITLSQVKNSWQSNISTGDSLDSYIQRGYIDTPNSAEQIYTVAVDHNYWLYDAVFYMSADSANQKYGSLKVNGVSYHGAEGVAVEGTASWGSTGNPAGVTTYGADNSFKVTGLMADLTVQNEYPDGLGTSRATLAGMQIVDRTEELVYFTTLGEGETATTAATWTRGNESATEYASIDGDGKYLGITAAAAGSILKIEQNDSIKFLGVKENALTLTSDGSVKIEKLLADTNATINVNAALLNGQKLQVAGAGAVVFNAAQQLGAVVFNAGATTFNANVSLGSVSGTGALNFGADVLVTLGSAIGTTGTLNFADGARIDYVGDIAEVGASYAHNTYGYISSIDLISSTTANTDAVSVSIKGVGAYTMNADGIVTIGDIGSGNYYIAGDVNSSTIQASGDALSAMTSLVVEGGTLTVDSAWTVPALQGTAGTIQLTNNLTISGDSTLTATTLQGEGELIIGANATLTVNSTARNIKSNIRVGSGATLEFLGTGADAIEYDLSGRTIYVNGGKIDVGTTRQTVGRWTFDLTGATIQGAGQSSKGDVVGLDFHQSSTINVQGAEGATTENPTISTIDTNVRIAGSYTLTYDVDANARLNQSGALKINGTITKDGAGTLYLSGSNTGSGAINVEEGTLATGRAEALGNTGNITIKDGAVLDVTEWSDKNTFSALNSKTTLLTEGTGYIKMDVADSNDGRELSLSSDTTLNKNFRFTSTSVAVHGESSNRTLTIGANKFIYADAGIQAWSKSTILVDDGKLNAQNIILGHYTATDGGHYGALKMTGGSISTGYIKFNQQAGNKVTIEGGSLEFTSSTALKNTTNSGAIITIGGAAEAPVTLKATQVAWTLDGTGLTTAPTIGNVTIDGDNTYGITLQNVKLTGAVTNNGSLTLSGTLDFSGSTLSTESALITMSTGASLTINEGAVFKFGALEEKTEYKFIDATVGGTFSGWDSIKVEQIYINGVQLNSRGYSIATGNGVFWFEQLIRSLTWTGSANDGIWDSTSQNWTTGSSDSVYVNSIDTSFTSDATATVAEAITTGNLTIGEENAQTGITVTLTAGEGASLAVSDGKTLTINANSTLNSSLGIDVSEATVSMGTGAAWNLTSGANQSLTKDQLGAVKNMEIALGATLTLNDFSRGDGTAFYDASALSGSGELVLVLNDNNNEGTGASGNGSAFNLENFTGKITVSNAGHAGRLLVSSSTLNAASTIALANNGAELVFNSGMEDNPTILTNNVTISNTGSDSVGNIGGSVHVTSDKYAKISGDISGSGQLFKQGSGQLTLSGAVTVPYLKVIGGTLVLSGTGDKADTLTYLGVGKGGTLNVEGAVTTGQLRMSEEGISTVNIKSGGSLTISGTNNRTETSRSLLLQHWGHNSTLTLEGGELISSGAQMFMSWAAGGAGTFAAKSGTATLLGINFLAQSSAKRGSFNLGSENEGSARVYIGSAGISNIDSASVTIKLGEGTLGALSDWEMAANAANASNVQLIGTIAGTVFNTEDANTAGTERTITINAALSGSGKLVKDGLGTLKLSGANTYTGATTVKKGILEISKVAAVNSSSGVEMESGAGLKYTGSDTETLSTPLSGAGSFTMAGSGTLTLSGANTYTGATTIESGTLQIAELSAISSSSGVSISSGAELKYTGGDAELSKALSGAGSFTVAGTGTLTVSTTLSHTGGTTIESGTLKQSGNNSVLGDGKNVTVKNGATLDVNGLEAYYNLTLGGGASETAAVLTNTGDEEVGDTKKQLYSITLADDATVTGTAGMCMIAGSHGQATLNLAGNTLTKMGSNTFTISRANVTAGTIKVLQGTVLAKQAGNSGSGSLNLSAASVYVGKQGDSFGTFELDSENQSVKDLTFDGGTVSTLNQKTLTATGTTQVKSTGGTLSGNLTATDKVSFENGGALKLGTSGKLKVQNAENSAQYIELSGSADASGITATSESSQLAQLAEDASFTIQDMVLSNVKLSAAEGAGVALNNVSGSAELAGAGSYNIGTGVAQYTLGMTPAQVGTIENDNGSTALTLSYSSNTAITMSGTGSQLLLSADPTVDANGVFGTYNLTLTLNYALDGIDVPNTTAGWQELVGFTGILGDLLTAQTPEASVDLAEGEAAVAAAGSTPTVEYNYTAPGTGAQVGTLVITISGLNVPEPASATLGLAALMMLCARRRRKA